jgi:hypothetical protein
MKKYKEAQVDSDASYRDSVASQSTDNEDEDKVDKIAKIAKYNPVIMCTLDDCINIVFENGEIPETYARVRKDFHVQQGLKLSLVFKKNLRKQVERKKQ